jgi:hypothetical protein
MDMIKLQEEAKRRFPVGCRYKGIGIKGWWKCERLLILDNTVYNIDGVFILAHDGGGVLCEVMRNGEVIWAINCNTQQIYELW